VEEAGVVGPQQRAEAGVVLVAGGRDRVEALVRELQPPRRDVERTRERLVLEERDRVAGEQPAAGAQRRAAVEAGRRLRGLEVGVELALDDRDAVGDA
jgi:hypothetical protein